MYGLPIHSGALSMSAVTDFAAIAADMARIKAEKEPVKPAEPVFGLYGWAIPGIEDTAPSEYSAPDYDGG
jgi:hypothetical protein